MSDEIHLENISNQSFVLVNVCHPFRGYYILQVILLESSLINDIKNAESFPEK